MTPNDSRGDSPSLSQQLEQAVNSPVERQPSRVVTSSPTSHLYPIDTPSWRTNNYQRPCEGTNNMQCEYCQDIGALTHHASQCESRTISRFGLTNSHQPLVYRGSMPSTWTSSQSNHHGRDSFYSNDTLGTRSQTTDIILGSPRLTRTQRSYINASPPSAREALTMRFIKANMTRTTSRDSASPTPRTDSITQPAPPLMRNCSAPVTGVLSRTTSIQPDFVTERRFRQRPAYVTRRGNRYVTQQRQISEPVGLREDDNNASIMQGDLDALNQALHEFQHNFTISPRDGRTRHTGEEEYLPSEQVAEIRSLYGPIIEGNVTSSYVEELLEGANTPRGEMDYEDFEYGGPEPDYYEESDSYEYEPELLGLPDDIVSQFPVTDFDATAAESWNEDAKQCSICLEGYEQSQLIRRLACTHGYHKACIDQWLSRSTVCPICKFDYRIMM